jgi:hypothetical protein
MLLVGRFRPLILKDHGALQTIWSEVAQELAPSTNPPKTDTRTSSSIVSDLARATTLLRAAVGTVSAVSYGRGPTTLLHRRIEIAEKWLQDSRKALSGVIRGKEADEPISRLSHNDDRGFLRIRVLGQTVPRHTSAAFVDFLGDRPVSRNAARFT